MITKFSASLGTSYPHLLSILEVMLSNNQVSEVWTSQKRKKKCNSRKHILATFCFFFYMLTVNRTREKKHATFNVLVLYFPERIFEAIAASACKSYFTPVHCNFISRRKLKIVLRHNSVKRNLSIFPLHQFASTLKATEVWFCHVNLNL